MTEMKTSLPLTVSLLLLWLHPSVQQSGSDGIACPSGCTCLARDQGIITGCIEQHFSEIPCDIANNTWELYLQGNTIHTIAGDAFVNHPLLRTIVLTDSGIHNLQPGSFNGLEDLTSLDLRDNKIKVLQSYIFSGLKKLERMMLDGNRIRVIESYAFLSAGRMYEGVSLSLKENTRLHVIQPHAFQGAKIQELYIYNASLSNSSVNALKDLKDSLKMLFILGNKRPLYLQPGVFSGFKLQTLSLENNGITNVDFLQHVTATDISLSSNPIGTVDFSNYTSLKAVRFLQIANTGYKTILSQYFNSMDQLSQLQLADNDILNIPEEARGLLSRLQKVSLDNNKLHCNCELLWFKDWLRRASIFVTGANCNSPFKTAVKTADVSMFTCNAPTSVEIERQLHQGQATLVCISNGDPAPTVTWTNPQGQSVHFRPQSIYNSKTIARLKINDSDKNGMYTCKAENIKGDKVSSIKVDVYETIAMARSDSDSSAGNTIHSSVLELISIIVTYLYCLYSH